MHSVLAHVAYVDTSKMQTMHQSTETTDVGLMQYSDCLLVNSYTVYRKGRNFDVVAKRMATRRQPYNVGLIIILGL